MVVFRFVSFVCLCVITFLLTTVKCEETRKLSIAFVCNDTRHDSKESYVNAIGIKAEGRKDTLYHVWSSEGSFTIMTLKTHNETSLSCNCSKIQDNPKTAITFSDKPINTFAVVLLKVVEFDWSSNEENSTHDFVDFRWKMLTVTENADSIAAEFTLEDRNNDTFGDDAIQIRLSVYSSEGRIEKLPHLLHTADSAVTDFTIAHPQTLFNTSRFDLSLSILSDDTTDQFHLSNVKTFDDEYTPGVFQVTEIESKKPSCYLQWKPTIYTSAAHEHSKSTVIETTDVFDDIEDAKLVGQSLASFLNSTGTKQNLQAIQVSFGMTSDKLFDKESSDATNYASWTFSTGYGEPPRDKVSMVVIVVIAVGLGIPLLLILVGSIYVFVKRCRKPNDDLLLNQ